MQNRCQQFIASKINQDSFITVAEFMNLANQHYYTNNQIFGERGDFVTSPEISQIFGEIIGAFLCYHWQIQGQRKLQLCELGPGRGVLMSDILRSTKKFSGFHENLEVFLLEQSPHLKTIQTETLKSYKIKVQHIDTIENLPPYKTFFIANEFFDALPISQFQKKEGLWQEIVLEGEISNLGFAKRPARLNLATLLETRHGQVANDSIIELNLEAESFMNQISKFISQNTGLGLFIDYGYYLDYQNRHNCQSTLQAIKNHSFHDPLRDLGHADLTAHVDFYALAQIARSAGINSHFESQEKFLLRNGAAQRYNALMLDAKASHKFQLKSAFHRLVSPEQMGELFKVLTVW